MSAAYLKIPAGTPQGIRDVLYLAEWLTPQPPTLEAARHMERGRPRVADCSPLMKPGAMRGTLVRWIMDWQSCPS